MLYFASGMRARRADDSTDIYGISREILKSIPYITTRRNIFRKELLYRYERYIRSEKYNDKSIFIERREFRELSPLAAIRLQKVSDSTMREKGRREDWSRDSS